MAAEVGLGSRSRGGGAEKLCSSSLAVSDVPPEPKALNFCDLLPDMYVHSNRAGLAKQIAGPKRGGPGAVASETANCEAASRNLKLE